MSAVKLFCRGFREYPFTVSALYASPKNLGMGNIWSLARDEKVSTMTGYTFDDYERWTTPYGYKIYTNCFDWFYGKCIKDKDYFIRRINLCRKRTKVIFIICQMLF